jgi:hypothetical protein
MVPRWVFILEGATRDAIDHVFRSHLSREVFAEVGAPEILQGVYSLQHDRLAAG